MPLKSQKPKLAVYWASSCGGCEIALVNLNEKFLELDDVFDFFFCPCLLDTKKKDVEALDNGSIAVTLFNGAIRTTENEEMARLLRRKSRLLIAFGSCAAEGCIPALANLHSHGEHMRDIYLDNPSIDNPLGTLPQAESLVRTGEITPSDASETRTRGKPSPPVKLTLPTWLERVKTLSQTVRVDYSIPGCPPEPHRIWEAVERLTDGTPPPPRGSVLGAGASTVCAECDRRKGEKKIPRFYRPHEFYGPVEPDSIAGPSAEKCLLEQGLLCMGIATREGCGALCPRVNAPCTGCYGPPEGVSDQGARMVAAVGTIIDTGDIKNLSVEEILRRTDAALDAIPDPAGTFYRYSLAGSILKARI